MNEYHLLTHNGISFLSLPALENFSFIRHAFSLKLLTESQSRSHGSDHQIDREKIISESAFLQAVGIAEEKLITLCQVHENQCQKVFKEQAMTIKGSQGDSLITSEKGIALGIRTADCYPVLMLDYERKVISCTHAGWRGLSKGILHSCLEIMTKDFSCSPETIIAAIGPGIDKCCFRIKEDVIEHFERNEIPVQKFLFKKKDNSLYMDLKGILLSQLEERGLLRSHMYSVPLCTFCSDVSLPSYRREGEKAGRSLSVIMLLSNEKGGSIKDRNTHFSR